VPRRERAGSAIRNVVLVSHCDFLGNSALHAYAIASELQRRGFSPVVAIPENLESVEEVGESALPVLTYADVVTDRLRFPDNRGVDLVLAFTPRELVRRITAELVGSYECRYVVHLEDNDEVVLAGEHGGADPATLRALPLPVLDSIVRPRQAHPLRASRFLQQAAGITVLTDRLLELVPEGVPATVIRAGFDDAVLTPRRDRGQVRGELGLEPGDIAIVYTGSIHALNREEVRSLYCAVAELRQGGQPIVLVKTGGGSDVAASFPSLGAGIRDLGWVSRDVIPELLGAADVLVQPGGPSPFNDYRFQSKLPDFLASGRPVVLPRTNVGLELRDAHEALLMERGDSTEIASAVAGLAADPALRSRIGEAGRAFALRELRWSSSVDRLEALLAEIEQEDRPPAPARALEGADPPAKLVAIVPTTPRSQEAAVARSHGIFGFCLDSKLAPGGGTDVEELLSVEAGWEAEMLRRLAAPLPEHPWHRTLLAPRAPQDVPVYSTWLRKLALQTALRPAQAPVLYVDASAVWEDRLLRDAWLAATQAGMRQAVRQFYASQSLRVSDAEADVILRST
jgi:glycosyltransferase involved in cell wall biosynthesis